MSVRKAIARTVALAVFVASLFAIAGPASAGDTRATIFIVHGLPGVKVDVCMSGLGEVTSGLVYAARDKRKVDADTYAVRVRRASKGECKGDLVTRANVTLAENANATLVLRLDAGDPSLTRFNNDVSPTNNGQIRFVAAHMMKGGAVDVWANGSKEVTGLARGATESTSLAADVVYSAWGTKVGETTPVVGPRVIDNTFEGQAFTFVMVGTKVANNRLVIFKQEVGTV